jgi:hypothetical protein
VADAVQDGWQHVFGGGFARSDDLGELLEIGGRIGSERRLETDIGEGEVVEDVFARTNIAAKVRALLQAPAH